MEETKAVMLKLQRSLYSKEKYREEFGEPVWELYPEIKEDEYRKAIDPSEPMDLRTVKERIQRGGPCQPSAISNPCRLTADQQPLHDQHRCGLLMLLTSDQT
jgi:hypothetical protein